MLIQNIYIYTYIRGSEVSPKVRCKLLAKVNIPSAKGITIAHAF